MLSTALVITLGITFLAAFVWQVWSAARLNKELELFPSLAWLCFIALPFAAEVSIFHPDYVFPQSVGVFLFGFVLLAGDSLAAKTQAKYESMLSPKHLRNLALFFACFALLIQILHILMMPKIPLVEAILGNASEIELKQYREDSNKLLNAPFGFLYLCQLSISLFAPIAIVLFASQKKWWAAGFTFLTTLIYSRINLAKAPVFTFAVLMLVTAWVLIPKAYKNRVRIAFAVIAAGILIPSVIFLTTSPLSVIRYRTPEAILILQPDTIVQTLGENWGDLNKDPQFKELPQWQQKLNYLVYRMFLDQIEVSHRWYQYYPAVKGSFIGLDGLTPSTRFKEDFVNPSNELGLWAFYNRFPGRYLKSVTAPASIDADAWSRFGYIGLFAIAFVLFLTRLGLHWFRLQGIHGDAINACALIVLGLAAPAAPIAALLFVQGVGVYLTFYLAVFAYNRFIKAKAENVG